MFIVNDYRPAVIFSPMHEIQLDPKSFLVLNVSVLGRNVGTVDIECKGQVVALDRPLKAWTSFTRST